MSVDPATTRDPDLEQVWQHASAVNGTGVQRLVMALQLYRNVVRDAFNFVEGQHVQSQHTTSIYRLKDHIAAINSHLSQVQFQLDLDHIDVTDLCNADGAYSE